MQVAFRSAVLPLALTLTGLGLTACSTELNGFGTRSSAIESNQVFSAPTGVVETAALPPPPPAAASQNTSQTTTLPGRTSGNVANVNDGATGAITPRSTANNVPLTPPAANPGATAYAPSTAQDQLAGAWTFNWDDGKNSCPLKLSTDRGLSGLAAQADISCPGEIFMTKGWSMMGPDLVLQNHQGKVTARLSPDGANRFIGEMTDSGQKIVLAR
ncbi:protease inhibitor Inh/omp19 family protein [Xanthobacter sp. TB0139]|uniref:protease inhibitor Inh/omp19 family protein n=1 Tax=Xanthobacter sp. TB0139 TaxID=3459178 RepID=UPI004039F9F8